MNLASGGRCSIIRVVVFLRGKFMLRLWIILLIALVCLPVAALAQDDADHQVTEDPEDMVVSAQRVSIEEVIAAIGLKMEQERYRMEDYAYTTLVSQLLRKDPGMELSNYSLEEYAIRFHNDRTEGAVRDRHRRERRRG